MALFVVDRSWLDGEVRAIGFGTGSDPSSQCGLDDPGSSFTTGDRISLAAWFDPPLPAGDTATITVTHDGKERGDLSGTVKVEDGHGCIAGDLARSSPGSTG